MPISHTIRCPRCGSLLARNHRNSLDKTLALAVTGTLLFFPAILLPLITLEKIGMNEHASVLDTVLAFVANEYYFVSLMTLLSAVLLPATLLGLTLTVTLQIRLQRVSALTARLYKHYVHLEEWAMVEVYLLGILVTIFKMMGMADIIYNAGFFSFLGLVFCTMGISAVMDKPSFWDMISSTEPTTGLVTVQPRSDNRATAVTAASAGLAVCLTCNKLHILTPPTQYAAHTCRRCGDTLHLRKPQSLPRTLALVLTSTLLLLPANLLPIMRVEFLGVEDNSTILDGILHFFETGSYLIGTIILVASVLVPLFKIVGLAILLCTTYLRLPYFLKKKSAMFRFIMFIGRWSMLDIFVIALLIALVDFGVFTTIDAAPATTFFCMVVAFTMLAANAFDPRIMWDNCQPANQKQSQNTL